MNWNLFIGIVIIVAFVALGIIVGIKTKKSLDNNYKKEINFDKLDGKSQLIKHVPYLWPKEVEFYDMYRKLLPADYLMVPKVGVDKIVKPHGSLVMYNAIKTKYVDFCIFKRSTMEPVVVVDCFYPSITDSTMKVLDPAVTAALKAVDIPVLQYEILDVPYDTTKVISRFYDALDPVALAQLRKDNKK